MFEASSGTSQAVTLRDIESTLLALTEVDPAELEPELRSIY